MITLVERLIFMVFINSFLYGCTGIAQSDTRLKGKVEAHFSHLAKVNVSNVLSSTLRADGMLALYLEGEPYTDDQGNTVTSQIFSLYKYPEKPMITASGKTPAMVLVHGGGGTAFSQWVEKWNDAGFAAIAIAVEGQTDVRVESSDNARKNNTSQWSKHMNSGPSRQNIYADFRKPITQQWMFHAVSATIRAKHYLASQPNIDSQHIGLTGISWGGVITSTVMGFDGDFDFSIPIYGCGFLDSMQNQYKKALVDNPIYKNVWEPGIRIKNYKRPSLWLTWLKDKHFALDAQASTYTQLTSEYSVSIKPGIRHGHIAGWRQPESYLFAQQLVNEGKVWAKPVSIKWLTSGKAQAKFLLDLDKKTFQVTGATIHYTRDKGHTGQANWSQANASVSVASNDLRQYNATYNALPADVTHWFINIEVQLPEEKQTYTVSSWLYSS